MLETWRRRVARWIAPPQRASGTRTYGGARTTRLTGGFGSAGNSSADAELSLGLVQLRSRSRQLMRDAPYAKRARTIVVNNVVGAGVGLQAQVKNSRGEPHERINDGIEGAWCKWARADSCHTGGALHFADFERAVKSEVFTTGEAFVRLHLSKFGGSEVPLALELIEAERVADDNTVAPAPNVRMGVEVDVFGRAIAYWVRERHPGDLRALPEERYRLVRVPADQMIHLRIVDRWPQTRGEPWLHTVLQKLNNMEEYSGSELQAARLSSNYFATLRTPELDAQPAVETAADGTREMNIEPGTIDELPPGAELDFHAPNRPNTALDPFMRYMLREVAAGTGVSYESLSRDYSQSNYSSSRLALLDDRDLWRVLQQWWARSFRDPLHAIWLRQAVYSRAVGEIPLEQYLLDTHRFETVRWKFRGWSWVDPTKEVEAYREAVRCGFTTTSAVIAQTAGGVDIDDVLEERRQELDDMAAKGLVFDTDPTVAAKSPVAKSDPPVNPDEGDGAVPAGTTPKPKDGAPGRVVSIIKVDHG